MASLPKPGGGAREGQSNVRVVVRCRPPVPREEQALSTCLKPDGCGTGGNGGRRTCLASAEIA